MWELTIMYRGVELWIPKYISNDQTVLLSGLILVFEILERSAYK